MRWRREAWREAPPAPWGYGPPALLCAGRGTACGCEESTEETKEREQRGGGKGLGQSPRASRGPRLAASNKPSLPAPPSSAVTLDRANEHSEASVSSFIKGNNTSSMEQAWHMENTKAVLLVITATPLGSTGEVTLGKWLNLCLSHFTVRNTRQDYCEN